MKRATAFALGLVISAAAAGQDLLECADPHVVNSFVLISSDGADMATSTDVPEQLAGVGVPRGFEWIGSRVTDRDTRAAFTTGLNAADARDTFNASLRAAGFAVRDESPANHPGFVLTSPPLMTVVCRDGTAGVAIVREANGKRYVTMSFSKTTRPRSCEEALQTPRDRSRGGLEYIPGLALPSYVKQSARAGGFGSATIGSAGDTYSYSLEVEGVRSTDQLAAELAEQLRVQGWTLDGSWLGTLSRGSAWTRQADALKLAGKLEIRPLSGGYHLLQFKVVPMR